MSLVPAPRVTTSVRPIAADEVLSPRNRAALANRRERPVARRALVADASPLNLRDKIEARRLRVLRQGWQEDAMNYADAVPELSFAYRFIQHCASRMRYFPALVDPDQPDGPPIDMKHAIGASAQAVPEGLADVAGEAMQSLGVGRLGVAPLQKSLSWNFGVPGEAYILGQEDPQDGSQSWSIRSIDEFMVYEDTYKLREVPLDPQGTLGWIDLDPAKTYAARMWVPHPRFRKLATSPMRALLDVAEELLLLSRDVRAIARSRLAGAGILKIPEGMRMISFEGDSEDGPTEAWFGRFSEIMMTPIAEEGVASAVVPIAVSGEADQLAALEHLVLDRPYSPLAMELRAEAIGRIATGLDIPREVLEGMSDPNHWGAWLVSDDTFRHHIEPQVIEQVDALTVGYLRAWLRTAGIPEYWVQRTCIWYDPTELITKPDPMQNAVQLHDRFVLSNRALLKAGGFSEEDQPDSLEVEFRMLQKTRTFPPNMVEAIFHAFDPALTFPPITTSGTIPGISPTGEEIEALPPPPEAPPVTATPGPGASAPPSPIATPSPAAPPAAAAEEPASFAADRARFAAAERAARRAEQMAPYARLSRRLAEVDAALRARVQQAATSAMLRVLDRAGARLRSKGQEKRYRAWDGWDRIKRPEVTNARVASVLGEQTVMALGYPDAHALLDADWSELRKQFTGWVRAAQAQATKIACQLAGTSPESHEGQALAARLEAAVEPAWSTFEAELNARAADLLYNPAPNSGAEEIDPNTVVKAGMVRRALTIAGGAQPKRTVVADAGPDSPDYTPEGDDQPEGAGSASLTVVPDGQIGTGDAVTEMLGEADNVTAQSFEWVHGPTMRPFEPHEELDGTSFSSWDDDQLSNTEGWPENDYYFPGDHDGCSCDFTTIWGPPEEGGGEATTSAFDAGAFLSDINDAMSGAEDATLNEVRASVLGDVRQAGEDARRELEGYGFSNDGTIAKPPPLLEYRKTGAGEYDWYFQLSQDEQQRLRNADWLTNAEGAIQPDQVAMAMEQSLGREVSVDEAMGRWLDLTRTIDASGLLERSGRLPANLARFGGWNWDNLAPRSGLSVSSLFNGDRAAATRYLAGAQQEAAYEMATRAMSGKLGPAMYQMSLEDYSAEVGRLTALVETATPISSDAEFGDIYAPEVEKAMTRLNELLPEEIATSDEMTVGDVWAAGQAIAKAAGLAAAGS